MKNKLWSKISDEMHKICFKWNWQNEVLDVMLEIMAKCVDYQEIGHNKIKMYVDIDLLEGEVWEYQDFLPPSLFDAIENSNLLEFIEFPEGVYVEGNIKDFDFLVAKLAKKITDFIGQEIF